MMTSTTIDEFFSRHERVALQFSAGKDSAATLWLLHDYWDQMEVVWGNPGDPYPETITYMEKVANLVPHFSCVLGDQPKDVLRNGWPVDIVPMENTELGRALRREAVGPTLRPFWECCTKNLWGPMERFIEEGGFTGVIRGQKSCDRLSGPLASGAIVAGREYLYPIEDWTDEQVFAYLGSEKLPPSYNRGLCSSLDCKTCTAYTSENKGRIADLRAIDPRAWQQVTAVHLHLLNRLSEHAEAIRSCHASE